jgi:hypothetical protein
MAELGDEVPGGVGHEEEPAAVPEPGSGVYDVVGNEGMRMR